MLRQRPQNQFQSPLSRIANIQSWETIIWIFCAEFGTSEGFHSDQHGKLRLCVGVNAIS